MKLGFDYRQMILIIACSVLLIQYCTACLLAETPEPWFQDTNGPFYSTSALYACNIVPFFFGREIFFKQWNHRDFSLAVPRIIPGYLEHVFQFCGWIVGTCPKPSVEPSFDLPTQSGYSLGPHPSQNYWNQVESLLRIKPSFEILIYSGPRPHSGASPIFKKAKIW